MSNYTPITDFAEKDDLPTGDPLKIVRGAEIAAEFEAIELAVATKANSANPTFTGNATFSGAVTFTGAADGLSVDCGSY